MQISAGLALWGFFFTSATGVVTAFTTLYWHILMQKLGLLLVLPVGLFLAGQIFLILKMQKSVNPRIKAIGETFGTAMQYLALFEGLVLTVLVIWLVSGVFGYTMPTTGTEYATDFTIGSLWLSLLIFGATGGSMLAGGARGRMVGIAAVYTVITVVVPLVLILLAEPLVRSFGATRPGMLLLLVLLYYLAASILGMWIMTSAMKALAENKA